MHVHPKPTGHEAHGAHLLGGTRKKPPNREEVGAVKDHFSEGKQQSNKRPPRQNNRPAETNQAAFETRADMLQNPQLRTHEILAKQAAHSIQSLLMEAAPNANTHSSEAAPEPRPQTVQPQEPSLNDLLALMCAK